MPPRQPADYPGPARVRYPWPMVSIAVIGAGAVGGYYGALLARAGHDVRFLMRGDLAAVRRDGQRGAVVPRIAQGGRLRVAPPDYFFASGSLTPSSISPNAIATASTSGPSTKPVAPKTQPSTLINTGTVWMRSRFLTSSG